MSDTSAFVMYDGGPGGALRAGRVKMPHYGPTLTILVVLTIFLQAGFWLTGWRSLALAEAVECGTAVVEARSAGKKVDARLHQSIRNQRDTLPFWTTLEAIGDFVLEPAGLLLRAIIVATAFSSLAALTGRAPKFDESLDSCAAAQRLWVSALAVRLALTVGMEQPEIDTSLVLALPAGNYPAAVWVALRQADIFALIGWSILALGGWGRGQVSLFTAVMVCAVLWALESVIRISWTLLIESGMRMMLVPAWVSR